MPSTPRALPPVAGPESHGRRVARASLWVLGLAAVVIALDVIFPDQITIGVLYVLPIIAGISLESERTLYALTGLVIAAIFLFFVLFPEGDIRIGLLDRGLSAIAMVGVAYVAGRQIRITHQLDDQRRRLAALMALQTDFVRAVSHDIRTPVGAVIGYAELLQDAMGAAPQSPQAAAILRGIERSCRNVVALTDNLLTTAKLDAGDFPVELAPFDLVSLVRDLMTELDAPVRDTSPRLHLDAPDALILASDAMRVRQILLNLMANALKYSPADHPVEVLVVLGDDGRARVHVSDTGPGIPAADHERIFEPYYQALGPRRRGGVGLGLPLARRLARALGGDVLLYSDLGKGSEFVLELPVEQGAGGRRQDSGGRQGGPES